MGGKSDTPDFGDVAVAQGDENDRVVRDQLYANRPTQYTPFGYTNWTTEKIPDGQGGFTDKWTQTQGLTPELQDILNKQIGIQEGRTDIAGMLTGRMGTEFGQEMDWGNLNPMGQVPVSQFTLPEGSVGDPSEFRQRGEDAVYNQAMSRLQPKFDSQRQSLELKMRNQGLSPGDEAWNSQMMNLGQQENDARNQALWSASEAGRAESGQMFGQGLANNQNQFNQALGANQQNFGQALSGSQYANQIRQQQMTEAMQQRGFSLNEINALLSGQQVGMPQMPNFAQSGQSAGAPIYTAAADQASVGAAGDPMSSLIGAGATLGGGWLAGR
jgi:hypothetical protein